jgi:hypothetical protein
MSTAAVIILIVVIIVVLAAIFFGVQASRRRRLQSTFGPEYDRTVADTGSRSDAEKELRERERRHASLELKPLSPESRARYSTAWEEVQIHFVDDPAEATNEADRLVTELISERGYPTSDYEDRLADLSVEHARTLGHYRDAHEISRRSQAGEASTEDLRQALVHYRALFADLLGTEPGTNDTATTPTPATDDASPATPAPRSEPVQTAASDTTPDSPSTPAPDTDVASSPDATSR